MDSVKSKTTPFTGRVSALKLEGAYHVLAKAQALQATGKDIIHLEIGEPDFNTPDHISMAAIHAITEGRTRYNPARGIRELREVIAEDAGKRRGVKIEPDEVIVGPGAKPILFFPTLALVEPGDEVIYPDPGYSTYMAMIDVAGGTPVPVPLLEENDFSFDLDAFDRLVNDKTRLIVLNTPSNPTGGVMPMSALEHIAEAAIKHDCWVMADEVYRRMSFGADVPSILSIPGMRERTIVVDGFSKTYAMTGWRMGFGIMPKALGERVELVLNHSVGCTTHFTQYAGIVAIQSSQAPSEAMVAEYRVRRDLLVKGLNEIPGIHCRTPQATFYAFPNITGLGKSSEWLADYLLEEAGVALLPGTAFGTHGEGYIRLCFANSVENLQKALERICAALLKIR
jgi:aspartate/methionine/tyrosine aminotransferase